MPSLTVVIIAYDEKDNLTEVVEETIKELEKLDLSDSEIIIVDDGSTDGTSEEADSLAERFDSVRAIHHGLNRRAGAALMTGYANAKCELVTWIAADGQNPPTEFRKFLENMGGYDMVITYYTDRQYTPTRTILSRGRAAMIRALFGPARWSHGPCMFRREMALAVKPTSNSGFAHVEFVTRARKMDYRIKLIGISARNRISGQSKGTNLRHILNVTMDMIWLKIAMMRGK